METILTDWMYVRTPISMGKRIVLIFILAFAGIFTPVMQAQCVTPNVIFPVSDGFETSIGNWNQDSSDDFDWTRKTGATGSSNTGPSSAFEGSYYMYTEASGRSLKTANLISDCFVVPSSGSLRFSFAYHMFGAGMGSFRVDVKDVNSSTWTTLWSKSGDQGNNWLNDEINLNSYRDQTLELRFSVTTGNFQSDVSIDDIELRFISGDDITCIDPQDESISVCDSQSFGGDVSTNDTKPAGAFAFTYTVTSQPTKGTLTLDEDGAYTYVPTVGQTGTDAFTYERCYSYIDDVDSEVLVFNPCGTGKVIDTYIEGIEGESNPSILIQDPDDLTRVIVEVWTEQACGTVTIEGVLATVNDIYRTDGSVDTEKIYRAEITTISPDGQINISNTGTCVLSSAVAYVERYNENNEGSSVLFTSDVDLNRDYVDGDDCQSINLPIGASDANRDITFTIPIHEKDNFRSATATITAGGVTGTGSTSTWSSIGQGAGEIIITLNNVSASTTMAVVTVCSPNSGGDSFGIGIVSANNQVCSEPVIYDCCGTADVSITFDDAECPQECEDIPVLNFQNPSLVQGSANQVNAKYNFSNVLPGIDGLLTIESKSHADIEILIIDAIAANYGGYESAIQPIIDYNFINGSGAFDPAGEKSVSFKLEFFNAGTNVKAIIPKTNITGVDIDGSGVDGEVREFIESSGFDSYSLQDNSVLNLSGSLKAKGPYTNYPDIDETELSVMISYNFENVSEINFTYGAEFGGATADFLDTDIDNSDEKRRNSLYLKCFGFNDITECPELTISGPDLACDASSFTLNSTVIDGLGTCTRAWQQSSDGVTWSNISGATNNSLSVINFTSATYYRAYTLCSGNSKCGVIYSDAYYVGLNPDLTVSIDYNGSQCFESNSSITSVPLGGTAPYSYSWSGPNTFTANTQWIAIPQNGNYFVTVTDATGCTAVTQGIIYEAFDPFIFSLSTEVW